MAQSKLKSVVALGTSWESKNGTMYNQTVEFEDGTKGTASSKTPQAKWVVGNEYTFEVTERSGYTNITGIKPVNGFGGGSKFDSAGMMVGNAISNSCLLVANGIIKADQMEAMADRICEISTKLKEKYK